ncbi:MAG: AarF/ABC1/UbiB kinase family protein [Rhodospirillaceae bacterium]|jgi:predicted unusual protein kinase regulating ubiquinone biosynthesis (AarF/ABC1/UbiB family)|nr:AarF/ABC1/UbiB kinase family protein [Rhodospirillaceae bacterium]MBT5943168.1 AarF/ABC1/UbiB kinase family protein [Rhodospirillaceae bacterium]MBT6405600.1 AarF/ABC1/UbiB kinase family protein [Rhodospirillaceae bacterium]MBT6534606.1 AarF/ABC1/UbiB kinase family protein [Rhodospirillaceae bacterium]MBT7361023.1 AarF/ABC1/UbiB kinase family protein [Rhodospirillaceae bacterium]
MTDDERATVRGQVGRYGRVGAAVGGAAFRMAGQRYLGRPADPERNAADLKAALGGLKGPLMKAAQILATIPDALPADYARELSELQANAPPMGWPFVRRRMAAELGDDWRDKFAEFDRTAARAASLGQVHKATSHDGAPLACKLQYPDMASTVAADLNQLKLVFSLYRRYDSAIDPSQIHAELAERLTEELDYRREARHTKLYGAMLADEAGVDVPQVDDTLSSGRLLTTGWLEGQPMATFAETADPEARKAAALNMFRAWYVPFYGYGVIHGDPHLGNYTVNDDATINLYDFGCIRVFPPNFVRGVIDLYHALREGDRDRAAHAYESWGFEDISNELLDALNIWAEFLYRPLMEDKVQRIQESESGLYGANIAHQVQAKLRELGGVTPPREFVLMDRAAVGLGSVFLRLRAELNWHRVFHELIDTFDVDGLDDRQAAVLTAHDLEVPAAG